MPKIDEILAERGKVYGDFAGHSIIAQALKDVMRSTAGWGRLAPDMREALEMDAHKIARTLNGDPTCADNWNDSAGYMKLVGNRLDAEQASVVLQKPKRRNGKA